MLRYNKTIILRRWRRFISSALVLIIISLLQVPAFSVPQSPEVDAKSAILIEKTTGNILYNTIPTSN